MVRSQPPESPDASRKATASDAPETKATLAPHDTPAFARQIQRCVTRLLPAFMRARRALLEARRRWKNEPHRIQFFHQVDDPYSDLALQAISRLREDYDVEFEFFLVSQTDRSFAPEPELLAAYARRDCGLVAAYYDLSFPGESGPLTANHVERVEKILAASRDPDRFLAHALEAGRALWSPETASGPSGHDTESRLRALEAEVVDRTGPSPQVQRSERLREGNALRARGGHYSGAMFRYAGEWYWGVDRLHHLERRLIELGAAQGERTRPRFDRPSIEASAWPLSRPAALASAPGAATRKLKLEIFPSLRSPYTAFIFERSVRIARELGVEVEIRPVLPMVMRGIPVPRAKAFYILTDALRESAHIGEAFGNMLDPVGRPVERGFSLWPFARDHGKGAEYLSAFLRGAFALGRPVGTDEELRRLIEGVGLSFEDARADLDGDHWREELEANRLEMVHELGLWGVPAFRLSGGLPERPSEESPDVSGSPPPDLCVWGQDRLWLIVAEIRRRL